MDKFNIAYERWRIPQNLKGIKVSDLLENRERRVDLPEEIDGRLKRFGYGLSW